MKTLIGLLLSLAIAPVPQVIAQSAPTAARERVIEDFSRFAGVWEAEPPFRQAEGPDTSIRERARDYDDAHGDPPE